MPVKLDKRRWATEPQIAWLMAYMGAYLVAQTNRRYDAFWPPFFSAWFALWPVRESLPGDLSETESEEESEPDVPLDSAEEEVFNKTPVGKRKQKEAKSVANKRAKKVCG